MHMIFIFHHHSILDYLGYTGVRDYNFYYHFSIDSPSESTYSVANLQLCNGDIPPCPLSITLHLLNCMQVTF